MKLLVTQSCLASCNPMAFSLIDAPIHGIFQAKFLKWIVITFSRVYLNLGIEAGSPALQADSLQSGTPGKTFPILNKKKSLGTICMALFLLLIVSILRICKISNRAFKML